MKLYLSISIMLFACVASFGNVGAADTATPATTATSTSTSTVADYHPSMGDLMTIAVQPRHIKLGLAVQNRNWAYAKYELSELRGAFNRIARTIPIYSSTDTAALFTSMTQEPLAAVEQAIKTEDAKLLTSAYEQLTETCNACHLSQSKAMVVIKVPDASMYSDQVFSAKH